MVTGAAGTGKTTLVYSLAYDLANEFNLPVLVHIPGTPLEARFLGALVDERNPQRIIIIIRHAAEHIRGLDRFIDDAKRRKLPITIILEERRNQWNVASSAVRSRLAPTEFELGALSEGEIDNILDSLARYGALEKLTGTARDYQVAHFTKLAHKELLVALRELTTQNSFDNIVRDEFAKIPSLVAQQAYVYVATVGQLDLALRYEILIRLLQVNYAQLGSEVFRPTEGVLISTEETGNSRHNTGFRIGTRHPIIASIIFDMAAPDDDAKMNIISNLLTQLDPGFNEDHRLLREVTRGRELIDTIASAEKRRALYERLAILMPNDPYVLRHRSILERDLGDPDRAVQFARQAVKFDRNNAASLNTLGLALELEARNSTDPLRRQSLILEATKLFDDSIRKDPMDAFGYLGKVYIQRQAVRQENNPERKAVLQADILSLLEDAYEVTGNSSIIATQLANQRQLLGTPEEAIVILQAALKNAPANTRLRDLWIRLEIDQGNLQTAMTLAMEGVKVDPTSWRLQRHIARLQQKLEGSIETVKGHYQAAVRHNRGDLGLMVELGAYLFMNRLYPEANTIFSQARDLPLPSHIKRQVRERWRDKDGRDIVFSGKVNSISGAAAHAIAIPENFEAFFWRTDAHLELRENTPIKFRVGFNAYGPVAIVII